MEKTSQTINIDAKRVLVFGATGMAGHVISTYLSELSYQVATISAHNKLNSETSLIDITDSEAVLKYLKANDFDVIINCVGVLVAASEERKDVAAYINAYFPHQLEQLYRDSKTKIIHLSTDCVFSGKNPPYREDSWPDGELFYDRTKALGELANDKDLTFRMSIIGPDMQESGIGLFNWFYKQTGDINGYTGSIWNGVTTIQLAKAIDRSIRQDIKGLYHLVPEGNISKYELLRLFKEVFNRSDIDAHPVTGVSHNKTLINTRKDFDFKVADYPMMIEEMKSWIKNHENLYPHYKGDLDED